jgi:hypothetical protein
MMRRLLLVGCFAVTLAVGASGCCVDACGVRRGPLGRPLPGPIDCECGGGGCGLCGGRPGGGPLQFARFRATCGTGCGEMYADEWASDPPDCCDPCDSGDSCGGCGNFGASGGCCRGRGILFNSWRNFWGRRYRPGMDYGYDGYSDYDMGYDGGEVIYDGGTMHGGEMIESGPAPKAAPQTPTPAARQSQSALKKPASRQPYYEPSQPPRPAMKSRMPGFRTASNSYPMNSYPQRAY